MNEISQFNEYSKSNINVTLRNSNDAIFNVSSKMEYSDKDESTKHLINTKDEDFASVIGCKTNDIIVPPPKPLIIPSLVQECSDHLALLPDEVIRGCNRLYMRKFVSLPRAMDVEYSRNIDIDSILYELSKESSPYKEYAEELIQNGIRVDEFDINTNSCPIVPLRLLTRSEKRVNKLVRMHDLICRYFLASISGPLKYVDTEIDVQIGNQEYTGHVTNVIDHGWSQCYPWYNVDSCIESNIPMVGETLEVDRVSLTDVPLDIPSPLKIGDLYHTMSDRSNMIANSIPGNLKKLLDNNIIQISHRQNITLTPFGWDFVKCINDFAPALLSSQTIGFFNKLGQDVMNGKVSKGSALKQGENIIQMVFDSIYSNKKMIVSRLGEVYKDIEDYTIDIDTCPSCGHKRIVRIYEKSDGKVRRFVGCTNFPECKESRSIPASGRIQVMDDVCPKSGETVLRILPDNNKPYTWALGIGPCFACDRKNKCDKGKKK
jgi:DNA topoisomerase-1